MFFLSKALLLLPRTVSFAVLQAVASDAEDCVRHLLAQGANPNLSDVQGDTALLVAGMTHDSSASALVWLLCVISVGF